MTLEGAFCLVSGVSSGIGLATARALLGAGAEVVGLARDEARLSALGAELGPRFVPLRCDLAAPSDRDRVGAYFREAARPVDAFVNNAAECVYEAPLRLEPAALARLFEVNVTAGVALCQAVAPFLRPGSHLVQVSSVTGRHLANAKFGPYGTTKAALDHLTIALRHELAPRGVRVGTVVLGLVDTPIYDKVSGFDRARAKLREHVPVWLRPEDVAETILWMLSRPDHVAVHDIVLMPSTQTQ